jgi:hypothetical protein
LSLYCGYGSYFSLDAGQDPSFQLTAQNLEKVAKSAHIPYILACHLQTDADADPAYHVDEDPDPDPTLKFYRIRTHNTVPNPYLLHSIQSYLLHIVHIYLFYFCEFYPYRLLVPDQCRRIFSSGTYWHDSEKACAGIFKQSMDGG